MINPRECSELGFGFMLKVASVERFKLQLRGVTAYCEDLIAQWAINGGEG